MPRRILLAALVTCNVLSGCGSEGDGPRGNGGSGASGGTSSLAGSTALAGSAGSVSVAGTNGVSMAGGGAGGSAATTGGSASGGTGGSSAGGMVGTAGAPTKQTGTPLVYIGGNGDFPLRAYELNKATGALTQRGGDEPAGKSPSYLAAHPTGPYLYSGNEENGNAAGVSAHHIKADGSLEPLNHQQGSDNCGGSCGFTHVAVSPNGKLLMAASYDGGSVSVFPINQDGTLGAEKQMMQFTGGGDAEAHSVAFHPSGNYCWVPTLGYDQVQQLKVAADGSLSANLPVVATSGNAGPRHMTVHPSGNLAFLINETNSTMVPYKIDGAGQLQAGTPVSTLPQGFNGESYGQHVKLSPDGRFLYGSNVGHDSIVVFSVDQASGALTWLQDQPSGGAWPRDFDVDPNGEVVVVANRDSNSLAVFKIGPDGKLSALGQPTKVPSEPTTVLIRYQP